MPDILHKASVVSLYKKGKPELMQNYRPISLLPATDTLDHTILINKLKYYGFLGVTLAWFQSYLNNHRQYVNFDGNIK